MASVQIIRDDDSVPIRIEIPDLIIADENDAYADRATRGLAKAAAKTAAKTTEQIYEEAIAMACEAAVQTAQRLAAMDASERPDEFEVTFGLSLGMGADTKIVNVNSGGQVQVRMQWNR
jgi:hypothetical protein